jgi:iron complex outermembrane receptor protein
LGDLALDKEVAVKLSTTVQKWTNFSVEVNPFINISNFMFLRPVGFETTVVRSFTNKPMQD